MTAADTALLAADVTALGRSDLLRRIALLERLLGDVTEPVAYHGPPRQWDGDGPCNLPGSLCAPDDVCAKCGALALEHPAYRGAAR